MLLEPYTAVGPVKFGMSLGRVRNLLGEPSILTKNRRGDLVLRYAGLHVTVSVERVVEVEVLPETPLSLAGVDVFGDPSALKALCGLDGDAQHCLGAIILMNLGISLTGFHDGNESQKSVTAFARGRFDILKSKMMRFADFPL